MMVQPPWLQPATVMRLDEVRALHGPPDLSARMWASVCNRGNAIAPAGVPGTFYLGDPRGGGTPICSTTTQNPINPGECTDVSCDWQNPPKGPQDVWFRADDDGSGKGTSVFSECRPANDLLHLPGTICNVPG